MPNDHSSAPHMGAAPQPRRLRLETGGNAAGDPNPMGSTIIASPGPNGEMMTFPENDPEGFRTSQPPRNPQRAAEEISYRERYGQVVQELGQQKEEFQNQIEEMGLKMEAMMLGMAPKPSLMDALGQNIDLNTPLNVGQLVGILEQIGPAFQSNAIRGSWDITDEEVQAALTSNPLLQNLPEPQKTEMIKKQVLVMRKRTTGKRQATEARPNEVTPERTMRPVGRTVPTPEANTPPLAPDVSAAALGDDLDEINAQYAELQVKLRAARNPRERRLILSEMKALMKRSQYAQNISDEQLGRSGWSQS